ncbi:AraC family transcriptional regulator [Pseudomonas sp. zfem005]|uniref:AraC family transcriptional regulator n=1 Tax=Pseudomonas sp. zfem005 TaxID=3078200 RepID=UPI00292776EE|nr:AraC family transcriptional regulator [Pseudomonas sp. zfem005]MDU9414271.1 AraC family transcriptional regulator [Pseudomonas sp. zfem005]
MHAFDHLIDLANLRGVLDLRCQLHGNWALDHPRLPAGQASYHILLRGECRLELAGQPPRRLRAGEILLLPRSDSHLLQADQTGCVRTPPPPYQEPGRIPLLRIGQGGEGFEMLCGRIHYSPGATLLEALPDVLVVPAGEAMQGRLAAVVELMRLEAEGEEVANQAMVDGLSVILFTLVMRAYLEEQRELPGIFALLRDRRLGKAALALLADLSREWPVEALAAEANMSRSSFMRSFTQLAGTSPGALVTRLRLERAQQLLLGTAMSIGAIALEVGYPSQASFSRVFRQHLGESPAAFRQRKRG